MRDRIKRSLALVLALILFAATVFTDDLVIAHAEEGSIYVFMAVESDVSGYENYPIDLKLKISYGGTSQEYSITDENPCYEVTYNDSYTYTYEFSSANYDIVLSDGKGVSGTLTADQIRSGSCEFKVESVSPKYTVTGISPASGTDLKVSDTANFSVDLDNENWVDKIDWFLEGDYASYAEIISQGSGVCTVKAKDSLPLDKDEVQVTLKAMGKNGSSQTIPLTISKKTLTINMEMSEGATWSNTRVIVTLDPAGVRTVDLYNNDSYLESKSTDGQGKVQFELTAAQMTTYNLEARCAADTVYKASSSGVKTITPGKESQEISLSTTNTSLTFGQEKVEIGTVSSDKTGEKTYSCRIIDENQEKADGTVEIVDGRISFTPARSGVFKIGVKENGDTSYNESAEKFTDAITVEKKIVTVKNVAAEEKTYDGEKNNIKVSAVLDGTVGTDAITLYTENGIAESADYHEDGRAVTAELKISEDDYKKYAFEKEKAGGTKELSDTIQVETTVKINKKGLIVKVGDATKEWQKEDTPESLDSIPNIEYEGLIGEDRVTKDPTIVYATPANFELDTEYAVLGIADDAVVSENYFFETVEKGKLTLRAEKVVDFTDYVAIDNTNSVTNHVYQPDVTSETIFYSLNNAEGTAKAVLSINNTIYDKIFLSDGTDITTEGVTLDEEINGTTSKEFYLGCSGSNGKTENFTLNFTEDKEAPDVVIKIGEDSINLNGLTKAITFGKYSNEEKRVTIDITEDTGNSGVSDDWKYCVTTPQSGDELNASDLNISDEEKFNKIKEQFVSSIKSKDDYPADGIKLGQSDNYVVYVFAQDKVGNTVLVGSNGVVIENIKMNPIQVSLPAGGNTVEGTVYYNRQVDLSVVLEEDTDSIFSGIKSGSYSVKLDGSKADKERIRIDEAEVETEGKLFPDREIPTKTLSELKEQYCVINKTLSVLTGTNESSIVNVEVGAEDFAGNSADSVQKSFVIDTKNPEVAKPQIKTSRSDNSVEGFYNTETVVVEVDITERFLDKKDILFRIKKDNEIKEISLELLEKAGIEGLSEYGLSGVTSEMTDESSDASISKVILTFIAEGDYIVSVAAMDRAGNPNAVTESGEFIYVPSDEFHIDRTAPVALFNYDSYAKDSALNSAFSAKESGEESPVYLNEDYLSFKTTLKVIEKNFNHGGNVNAAYTITAKSPDAAYTVSETDFNSWDNTDDTHKYTMEFNQDARYSFAFRMYDNAGNFVEIPVEYVTLDKTKPTGSVTVNGLVNGEPKKSWLNYFLSGITFGLFGNTSANATMTSEDATSGVKSTQYLVTDTYFTKDQVAARTDWTTYERAIGLAANRNVIVYEKVVDKADNTEYYSSDSFVMDNVDPAPVVTITPSSPAWGKGVYSANDNPGFNIDVTDPVVNNAYSGLKEITYKIVNGTTGAVETGTLAAIGKTAHQQSWTGHVNIDPNKFYSNDVQVTVTASDWSTNDATSETATLKIDNKAPIVKFSFDKSDAQNEKYYKNNKTLTITVDERNFDKSYTPKVTSTAGGGYSFSGWSTNGEISTGTVTFSGDSDYTVTFDCYDLAGNKSNTEKLDEFTVDKTNPTISVSYDNNSAQNGNYYKAARTATITITEHNFRAGDVRVTTTASNGGAPGVSGWSTSGDRHTATVHFGSDADYTFDISYIDLAGNAAADYDQDRFTVDLTKPSLEITGVQNKSANKGTVAPIVKVSDTNFIASGVSLSLTGANKGKVNTSNMITTASAANGETITFLNFGSGMDDIYTLTAKAVDKAGNDITKSITFSVNRDGSTYVINDSTKKLIEKGFTNNPQDIVIQEINVDTLEFLELSYSKDGKIKKLEEGEEFKVDMEGAEGQWKKYTYTVFAKCFDEEGEYSINISSTDRAENINNNKVQAVNVDFVVDKTSPVMAVSNLENRKRYTENSHEFTLNVKDNTSLVSVAIYLDDELFKTYELVDGKLVNINDASDVLEMDNGKVYLTVDSKDRFQKVKIVSTDAAGNVSETEDYNVLITANKWVQFYMNKPLFFGSIAVLVILIGGIFFIVMRRRKSK